MSVSTTLSSRLSICIVSWNCAGLLESCLKSLEAEVRAEEFEIIVVDNASQDGCCALVRESFPWVRLIANQDNLGFTRATNQALEASGGRHRLLLNPDTEVPEGCLASVLDQLEQSREVGVLGCRVEYPDGSFQPSRFRFPDLLSLVLGGLFLPRLFPTSRFFNRERYGNLDGNEAMDVDCVMGGFFLIRGEALEQTGLLDESYFMYAEEMDLAWRMKVQGWKVRWVPEPTIRHLRGGTTAGDSEISAWCYGAKTRGQLFFIDKWRGRLVAWVANLILLVFLLPRLLIWMLQDLSRGKLPGSPHKLLRGRILRHRLACLFRPSCLESPWNQPPNPN